MLNRLLQVSITPEDTAAVSKFEANAREAIEHIATTPVDELLPELINNAIHFGIKVLIALLIYLAGAWLIKKIRGMLHRIFERRRTEKAIASFVESLTSISLTIILVIITVGTLGINTTSLAALLAAGGMAIGMALSGTVQNFAGGIMILMFKPFKAIRGSAGAPVETCRTLFSSFTMSSSIFLTVPASVPYSTPTSHSTRRMVFRE